MKANPIPLIAALLLSFASSAQLSDDRVFLKSGFVVPPADLSAAYLDELNRGSRKSNGKSLLLLQFETIPTPEMVSLLKRSGIDLLEYIPNRTYLATVARPLNAALLRSTRVRAVTELQARQKMRADLTTDRAPGWARRSPGAVDVLISFPPSFDLNTVREIITAHGAQVIATPFPGHNLIHAKIAWASLENIAALPVVSFMEPVGPPDQPLNNFNRSNSRANVLQAAASVGGRNLKGEGVVIGIGDNADPLHADFTNRLIRRAAAGYAAHGTHVHGIAGGAGIINELYTGYSPKATLISQVFSGILNNAAAYVTDHNMVVTNNSYGQIVNECSYNGLYDQYSRVMDQQAASLPSLLHVFAAGNSATGSGYAPCPPYPTDYKTVLGSYQSAKNVITVGNTWTDGLIFQQSSRGPVQDGRIKPEITAQGTLVISSYPSQTYFRNTGTSMAAPAVAGGLGLLYQRYRQLNGNANPANGLMKAILCNTATDRGNPGPDYTYGFGWMNLLRAVQVIENNQFSFGTISHGGSNSSNITVPSNTAFLKVMLYWNDPAAAAVSAHTLVNDLDLSVITPSSSTVLPLILDTVPQNVANNAAQGVDRVNNIEQVMITNPAAGTYSVQVGGTSVPTGPQQYFLTYDIVPISTTLTFPIGGERFTNVDSVVANWDAFGDPNNAFTLEYSLDNGGSWTTINNNIASNLRQYKWYVPNVATTQAKLRISRNGTSMSSSSGAFTILGVPTLSLDAVQCEGYIAISWTSVSGATDYEVMMLRGDEMTSVATTAATSYVFTGLSRDSVYWVTVRARISGTPGFRAVAVSRQPNSGTCAGTISDNDLKLDSILSPGRSGRKYTSTEFSSTVPVTIRIKNLDDAATAGNVVVSYSVNGGPPVTETIVNPGIGAGGTYSHTFGTAANFSSVGTYSIKASVTRAGDVVTANDSVTKTVGQLDNAAISLVGTWLDDMETASSQTVTVPQNGLDGLDRYDFTASTGYGRLRTFINTGIAYSGSKAASLDVSAYQAGGNVDSLTGTFNLSAYNANTDDVRLDFRFKNHGQGSNAANRVWIRGSDTQPWVLVYDLYANQNDADGTYRLSNSIQLSDSLLAYGQNFSSSFQVRWGQWGQLPAADNFSGSGYSFDDVRLYRAVDDLELVSVDTPIVSSCNLSATTPVRVTVRNNSNSAVASGISVRFRVNGGSWTAENLGGVAANTSLQHTFAATANLAASGAHTVEAEVLYASDSYAANNTASVQLNNGVLVSSFPYLEDFESGSGAWYSEGKNSSWEFGNPASYKINRAASGSKAWKTRLAGNYNDHEYSYLYSPCLNVTGLTNPTLSFSVALDLEDCGGFFCDGVYVEYSTNGTSWTRLGANGQGTNWYNKAYSGNNLWSVKNYTRWHVATIPLPAGASQLRLRFVVRSDASVNREGVAVDDIHVYDNVHGIYDGVTMTGPVNQNIPGGAGWVDFLSGGKLVASIRSTDVMGSTDVQAYINTGAVRTNSGQYYHDRNITVKPANGAVSDSATVRFYFLDSETERLISATGCSNCYKPSMAYQLGVSKYNDPNDFYEDGNVENGLVNSGWSFIPTSKIRMVPFDKGYYWEFKVKEFCEFWLNNGGFDSNQPLPVRLVGFTATKQGKDAILEWRTASEFDIDGYEIQLAKGNAEYQQQRFERIGYVRSPGNAPLGRTYSFVDAEAGKSGVRYYRLKIVEIDGSFSYSPVRPVVFDNDGSWVLYPNPSGGLFTLDAQTNPGERIELRMFDAAGRLLRQWTATGTGFVQKLVIDLRGASFPSGIYQLEVKGGEQRKTLRLVKE
ncbi:MAG TPA: S8 family serine peptidase [Chitinophagaceae bacterium]|nr:S8 family serine peptidase [Chitinophagaceae bacterium]